MASGPRVETSAPGLVPALEELLDHLWGDGTQEAIAGLVPLLVGLEELVEMVRKALPEG